MARTIATTRKRDVQPQDGIDIPHHLATYISMLQSRPELHKTIHDKELQENFEPLRAQLLHLAKRFTTAEEIVDGVSPLLQGMPAGGQVGYAEYHLSSAETALNKPKVMGAFGGLEVLMGLLKDLGGVDADKEKVWADIQGMMTEIEEKIGRVKTKLAALEGEKEDEEEGDEEE